MKVFWKGFGSAMMLGGFLAYGMAGYFNLFGFQRPAGHIIRQFQPEPGEKGAAEPTTRLLRPTAKKAGKPAVPTRAPTTQTTPTTRKKTTKTTRTAAAEELMPQLRQTA